MKNPAASVLKLLVVAFLAALGPVPFHLPSAGARPRTPSASECWVGKYSQCSYNALAAVLTFYYGRDGSKSDRTAFEKTVFVEPLNTAGFGPYYGWGPWTSYMVNSGKVVWNDHPVTQLRAERFSVRPQQAPTAKSGSVIVHYGKGEREKLRALLRRQLARGPVILWTPYAGARETDTGRPWHHVAAVDEETDEVSLPHLDTHSVTLFANPDSTGADDEITVVDCSLNNGVFTTDIDTVISTGAAMTQMVRLPRGTGKSMLDAGFNGVEDDQYNVVFFPAGDE